MYLHGWHVSEGATMYAYCTGVLNINTIVMFEAGNNS